MPFGWWQRLWQRIEQQQQPTEAQNISRKCIIIIAREECGGRGVWETERKAINWNSVKVHPPTIPIEWINTRPWNVVSYFISKRLWYAFQRENRNDLIDAILMACRPFRCLLTLTRRHFPPKELRGEHWIWNWHFSFLGKFSTSRRDERRWAQLNLECQVCQPSGRMMKMFPTELNGMKPLSPLQSNEFRAALGHPR